jgi:hypothetical protein
MTQAKNIGSQAVHINLHIVQRLKFLAENSSGGGGDLMYFHNQVEGRKNH